MKRKTEIKTEVLPMPNSTEPERYMVLTQYTDGGMTHTDDNDGNGYTLEEAQDAACKVHGIK